MPSNSRIFHDASDVPPSTTGRAIVIGNFDGVHRGHLAVLARAHDEIAKLTPSTRGVPIVTVLTFNPHPARLVGREPPALLTRMVRRAELLLRAGAVEVVAQRFDAKFASQTAEEFAETVLARDLHARVVVVGHDFRFGAKRAGDLPMLKAFGARLGFDVCVQAAVGDSGGLLSSTRAREAISAGRVDEATAILGRPHALEGLVEHGAKRGRTIGYPTANLGAVEELRPSLGVYAVAVDRIDEAIDPRTSRPLALGVANVGVRPTVTGGSATPNVEVHLFDLPRDDRDLYGAALRVHFVARLRAEQRFDGLDALKAQIARDADDARVALTGLAPIDRESWF